VKGVKGPGTAERILDVAERMVQERGFNGFSYADIAAELRVSKPALHYHYPGKAELGVALVDRYTARFTEALASLDNAGLSAPATLAGYANLYLAVLREHRMCLCGMLAAEYTTLPEPMQASVLAFFAANEAWLTTVLDRGITDGTVHVTGATGDAAATIVSGLEGAMLLARPHTDLTRFETAAAALLAGFTRLP
jgi:TetR/AcrR family transcriptional repressor of nem operon